MDAHSPLVIAASEPAAEFDPLSVAVGSGAADATPRHSVPLPPSFCNIDAPTIREVLEERSKRTRARSLRLRGETLTLSGNSTAGGLRQAFPDLIPDRPYCADGLEHGLRIRAKSDALRLRHLQLNGPASYRWMVHDIDRADAYFAHDDANLPPPNVIMVNPVNGHAHSAYLLASPVACHSASRLGPLRFYAACERGVGRRLESDRFYTGLIAKNPLHRHWKVEWRRNEPYELSEIEDNLFERDMRPYSSVEHTCGTGRNVTVFDDLRHVAYREIREFARCDAGLDAWRARCLQIASASNQQFQRPLNFSEVRAIAKSVANWTWKRFSPEQFRARQSHLGKKGMAKRWNGHVSLNNLEPWKTMGISRCTYFRRKAKGKLK